MYGLRMFAPIVIFCIIHAINGGTSPEEKAALEALYEATRGEYWKWTEEHHQWNFTDTSDPCDDLWEGIYCQYNDTMQRDFVREVHLYNMNLKGTLPSDISILSRLDTLFLAINYLTSTLPPTIGALHTLTHLDVGDNLLSGTIPIELSSLHSLELLTLRKNLFVGSVHFTPFASLTSLKKLDLEINQLTGSISDTLFNNCLDLYSVVVTNNFLSSSLPAFPPSVRELSLHHNFFTGTIRSSYFTPLIQMIDVDTNYITGTIPDVFTNAIDLRVLATSNNLLSGTVSDKFSTLLRFHVLQANNNLISGTIPNVLYLPEFSMLSCSNNLLTGTMPRHLSPNDTDFGYFNVASNYLTGSLPLELMEHFFMVSDNLFTGSIPQDFFSEFNTYIDLSRNRLSGTVPPSVSRAFDLYTLMLSQNHFSGTICQSLFDIPSLIVLSLTENQFSGSLPSISGAPALATLVLADNHFHGSLPSMAFTPYLNQISYERNRFTGMIPNDIIAANAEFISASYNYLDGTLPDVYTTLKSMKYIDFGNNYLTGKMYSNLGDMDDLLSLNVNNNMLKGPLPQQYPEQMVALILSDNYFTGSLPQNLSSLRDLTVLFLQNNHLSGSLYSAFSSSQVALDSIDLSNNALTGALPDILFQLPNLRTIALVKNCFRTKLPRSICDSSSVRILALDGLAAGSQCRNYLWDPFSIFGDSYFIHNSRHTIPSCIFDMANLTTLHLSGNGLTGNIESVRLKSSSKLTSLSLSHNRLSGTIPGTLKNGILRFYEFDMSHNRFSDEFSDKQLHVDEKDVDEEGDDSLWSYNVLLSLEVNRFSGDIPHWMNRFDDVKVLSGNMFQCSKQGDLPPNDPNSEVYICGSGELDSSLWVFLSACVAGVILGIFSSKDGVLKALGMKGLGDRKKSSISVYEWMMNAPLCMIRRISEMHNVPLSDLLSEKHVAGVMRVDFQNRLSCKDEQILNVNLLCDTNTYLLGICRFVLSVILVIVLPCIVILKLLLEDSDRTQSQQYRWFVSAAYMSGTTSALVLFVLWSLLVVVCAIMIFRRHNYIRQTIVDQSVLESLGGESFTFLSFLEYAGVIVLNMVVVFVVNGAYIYIQLKDVTRAVQIFSQVSLAGFKLVWDTFAVGAAISWISSRRKDNLDDRTLLYTALLVFNNIIAPCFVTAVTDDTCFKGFFEEADTVTVEYENTHCTSYSISEELLAPYCSQFSNRVFTTSYVPPFNYNYQCSSAILKSFIPVFVYAYAFMILALPVMDVAICSVSVAKVPLFVRRNLAGVMWLTQAHDLSKPLIRVDRVISTLMRHLAVLLTFGFAYPLLGVGVVIAMIQYVWKWRLLIIRYVATISITATHGGGSDDGNNSVSNHIDVDVLVNKLNTDCRGSWRGAYVCLWAVIWPGALFMGCLVFDILGDKVGWKDAIWILAIALSLPLFYWSVMKSLNYYIPLTFAYSSSDLDTTRNPIAEDNMHAL